MAERRVIGNGQFAALGPDGVRVGDLIHLSGVVSMDAEGNPLHEGDFLAQNVQVYTMIDDVLAALGGRLSDVVKETVFVTDMSMPMGSEAEPFEAYGAMRNDVYGGEGHRVAHSLVQCAGLVLPQLLVQIDVIAHV